jgi:catechol 2,3-dioxygenase-like lactoylglutathione lyase family enzyme
VLVAACGGDDDQAATTTGAGTSSTAVPASGRALGNAYVWHVNVNCSDLDRSLPFYANALGHTQGIHTAPPVAQPGAGFGLDQARWDAWVLFGADGPTGGWIDLLEWQEPKPTGSPPAQLVERGYQRIGVVVPDLDATVGKMRDVGGSVWSEPFAQTQNSAAEVRHVMVSDPDGAAVELIEGEGPRLSFVAVTCDDLPGSVDSYSRLGFREKGRSSIREDDGARYRIDGPVAMGEVVMAPPGKGPVDLKLVGFTTPEPIDVASRPANSVGIWRIGFIMDDIDAVYGNLQDLDVPTLSPPVEASLGPGFPSGPFFVAVGPDDEKLELIQDIPDDQRVLITNAIEEPLGGAS